MTKANGRAEFGRRPEATTYTVEVLVEMVRRGHMRVPPFQRALKWKSQDVLSLFDSIYRGYPIGSLLLNRGPAEAARLVLGHW